MSKLKKGGGRKTRKRTWHNVKKRDRKIPREGKEKGKHIRSTDERKKRDEAVENYNLLRRTTLIAYIGWNLTISRSASAETRKDKKEPKLRRHRQRSLQKKGGMERQKGQSEASQLFFLEENEG